MVKIIEGDVFKTNAKIIAHQVNCLGVMGSGVALQVKQKFPNVFQEYKNMCETENELLGSIQCVNVANGNKIICNLFGQELCGGGSVQYTSIPALRKCFVQLRDYAKEHDYVIAMPYGIGCVRGGANWNEVYSIIQEIFIDCEVELWRYDQG